ncbi:MAG: hypothetical protein LBM98_13550, partial [Oscillospiraceae bacterium]|nr:hypothetical protein [Oscillospiraceae bacterium]
APLHRGAEDEGCGRRLRRRTSPAGRISRPFPIPSVEGWLRRAGVVSPPCGRTLVQTTVSDI